MKPNADAVRHSGLFEEIRKLQQSLEAISQIASREYDELHKVRAENAKLRTKLATKKRAD